MNTRSPTRGAPVNVYMQAGTKARMERLKRRLGVPWDTVLRYLLERAGEIRKRA